MLKIMQERDNLMKKPENRVFGKIYVVIPTPMFKYVQMFVDESIIHKDLVLLVPSIDINPEKFFYYQATHGYQNT